MQIPGRSEGRRRSPKSVPDIFLYRHNKLTHAKGGDNVGERYLSSAAGATRGDIGASLGLQQPSVSKHLRVLRGVGLARVRRDGRQMLYRPKRRSDQAVARVDE